MARRPRTYLLGCILHRARTTMRLPKLTPETMTPRQRELHDKIAGKRGKVGAPYQVWLYSPELCERVESLGAYLRWDSAMPAKYRELCLLMAAKFVGVKFSRSMVASLPIYIVFFATIAFTIFFPDVVLWLPKKLLPQSVGCFPNPNGAGYICP